MKRLLLAVACLLALVVPAVANAAPSCAGSDFYMQCVKWPHGPLTFGLRSTDQLGFDDYGAAVPTWVARQEGRDEGGSYLSDTSGKDWTPAQVQAYKAAGLGVVAVWETTQGRAEDGILAGEGDAQAAASEAAQLGQPTDRPIFFSIDTDAPLYSVEPYFQGLVHELGLSRVGVYGGYYQVTGLWDAHLVSHIWQTVAWSHGLWNPNSCLRQTSINDFLEGFSVDNDVAICPDYGQFFYTPPPPPKPPDPQKYGNYPNTRWRLFGQKVRERTTVRTWNSNRCLNPVRRRVCQTTHYHLALLLGRDQHVYGRQTKAERHHNLTGDRIQEIVHRLTAKHLIKSWVGGL